ncbi:MAG TPA: MFS transporter [Acidisoma sp.]|uniref:MFS transporter n=1 Tax=Acidisoma sp. TaxID=1872115 RepID=UPI002C2EFEC7|nr:MFS transporter [Acidisoma sp.]HTI02971.1 MFS transporter [Acidisoma sp.]
MTIVQTSAGALPAARTAASGARVRHGTIAYRRIATALFLAGFATFSLLYCTQPLMPLFARHFHLSPAASSLSLSVSTGALAVSIVFAAMVSEGLGRRGLIFTSMAGAAILNVAAAFAPQWPLLLAARAAEGLVLGGVPAVAMAYLAEEIDPASLGLAMGLYIAGTAFGGMAGRVLTGLLAAEFTWRPALAIMGGLGLAAALGFRALLPGSRFFTPRRGLGARYHLGAWGGHLADSGLPFLFAIGFLVMGAFVTVYNYAGFRLIAPPYSFSQTFIGLIFTTYVFGIGASSLAGAAVDRVGRRRVLPAALGLALLGTLLTMARPFPILLTGIVLLTIGFFAAHSVASGWVGRLARSSKGHASSLYLLAYYLGSSVAGTAGGWFWSRSGWNGVAGFAAFCLVLAILCALAIGARSAARQQEPAR